MPRPTIPDQENVLKVREPKQNPPISKVKIIKLAFNKPPILTGLSHNNSKRDSQAPKLTQKTQIAHTDRLRGGETLSCRFMGSGVTLSRRGRGTSSIKGR